MVAINIIKNKLLKSLGTFGIGGPAKLFTSVSSIAELRSAFSFAKKNKVSFYLLGNGSNSLFPDEGLSGLVIQNKIRFLQFSGNRLFVGSGFLLPLLARKTAQRSLSGLEFALSIPGTVGGAIWMNAGASGFSTSDTLEKVGFVDEQGVYYIYDRKDLHFSYRYSCFQEKKGAIVWASFLLRPDCHALKMMALLGEKRRQTQPLQEKSIGSIFKNPQGYFVGKLIEELGLKNCQIGGAKISSLHANFIINAEKAQQKDVLSLIGHVKNKAYARYNVHLQEEITIFS